MLLSNLARDDFFFFLFVLSFLYWGFYRSYLDLRGVFVFVVVAFLVFNDFELITHLDTFASIGCRWQLGILFFSSCFP